MYELTVEATFSSAHNIRGYEGLCENLHGHNWKVEAAVASKALDTLGMVVDFKVLKTMLNDILDPLDHRYLNDVPPFDKLNATAENIARHVFKELSKALKKKYRRARVTSVRVWESEKASAVYSEE